MTPHSAHCWSRWRLRWCRVGHLRRLPGRPMRQGRRMRHPQCRRDHRRDHLMVNCRLTPRTWPPLTWRRRVFGLGTARRPATDSMIRQRSRLTRSPIATPRPSMPFRPTRSCQHRTCCRRSGLRRPPSQLTRPLRTWRSCRKSGHRLPHHGLLEPDRHRSGSRKTARPRPPVRSDHRHPGFRPRAGGT
jgi:hypothetical protein